MNFFKHEILYSRLFSDCYASFRFFIIWIEDKQKFIKFKKVEIRQKYELNV